MYLSHYNLVEKPFQISTDPKFLWLGEKHREALAVLKYSIINNQGFVLLTGDVGTGKTTLINALVNSLDEDTIVAVVSDPKLDRLEFFNLITRAFKINKVFKNKLDFSIFFGQFLNYAYNNNKNVLLVIDEAQNVSLELLEEIRLLSNIEIPERKLLNIFFVGQSEFNRILMTNECRPLRQRITVTYNIESLTENETREYIAHRLEVAGTTGEIFTKGAIEKVYSFSKGYPRLINIMCDHALLTGYVKDLTTITPKVLKECTKELSLPGENKSSKPQRVRPENKERKRFGKRAVLYSCLLFLLIPLVYPPVSTTLKGYLTNVINFYDQLFQQLAGPAHSHKSQEPEVRKPEKTMINRPLLQKQLNYSAPQPISEELTNVGQPAGKESTDPASEARKPIDLQDCNLVIPFGYNSNEVPESAYGSLAKCARIMMQSPSIMMVIKGYSDNAGSGTYNKKLSAFRANIVKSYLVGQGITPSRITAVGIGEKKPLKPNTTREGRRANRRVEIELAAEQAN
jgi:general secretion pathway protein A